MKKRRRKQHHRKMKSIERKKVHFKVLFFRCCAQCKRGESIKKAAAKAISISRIACLYVLHNGQRDVIASRCGNLCSGKFSTAETSSRLMRRRCRREKGKGRAAAAAQTDSFPLTVKKESAPAPSDPLSHEQTDKQTDRGG